MPTHCSRKLNAILQVCWEPEHCHTAGGPGSGTTTSATSHRNRIHGVWDAKAWWTFCENFMRIESPVAELWFFSCFFFTSPRAVPIFFLYYPDREMFRLAMCFYPSLQLSVDMAVKVPHHSNIVAVCLSLWLQTGGIPKKPGPPRVVKSKCVKLSVPYIIIARWA